MIEGPGDGVMNDDGSYGQQRMPVHAARGTHAMIDLAGCESALLDDGRALRRILHNACTAIGATVLHEVVYPFEPQGTSVVLILAESHASIHTYPEHHAALIDIFTCGDDLDPMRAATLVANDIPHAREHAQHAFRGVAPRTR